MKICIVGGTGNISSSIVDLLIKSKHEVVCFNRGLRGSLPKNVRLIKGDRSNFENFEKKIQKENFDDEAQKEFLKGAKIAYETIITDFSDNDNKLTSSKPLLSKKICLLYTSPSPRDRQKSRMPSSA